MNHQVLLFRAINVGGRNRVPMPELKSALSASGFTGVQSYLQTGNVVVDAVDAPDAAAKEAADVVRSTFSVETTVFIRTANEIRALIAGNPFPAAKGNETGVVFVDQRNTMNVDSTVHTESAKFAPDTLQTSTSGDVYVHCPTGFGTTRLTVNWIEKTLECQGTRRNWKTLLKIAELTKATR